MIEISPIGRVVGGRVPAVDDDWGNVRARIELHARFGPETLAGLDMFSHVEIVYQFDQVDEADVVLSQHPRGRTDWPLLGIFAQRGRTRPNRIGVTICRLIAIDGAAILVEGLDAIDGTPVLDIKPVVSGFLPRDVVRQPSWADEIMERYW